MRMLALRGANAAAWGFGLSKAATSIGYLSAMGSVAHNIGFVTELWFMLASEAVSFALALVVGMLAARGGIPSRGLPQWPALAVLFAGFALGATGALDAALGPASAGVLGALYGIAVFLFSLTWLEEFSRYDPRSSHVNMVGGLLIQMAVVACSSLLPAWLLALIASLAAVVSVACYARVCRRAKPGTREGEGPNPSGSASPGQGRVRSFIAKFGTAYACLFVLVGVVGILHTSVLDRRLSASWATCPCGFLWPLRR